MQNVVTAQLGFKAHRGVRPVNPLNRALSGLLALLLTTGEQATLLFGVFLWIAAPEAAKADGSTMPTVTSVWAESPYEVLVQWNESVSGPSATTPGNYTLDGGVIVTTATLVTPSLVKLSTSVQQESTTYALYVEGVEDTSGNTAPVNATFRSLLYAGSQVRLRTWPDATSVLGDFASQCIAYRTPTRDETKTGYFSGESLGDGYFGQLRGWFTPDVSDDYVFFCASDDGSELYLSTDADPANKQRIASVPGWTNAREWSKYPEQHSTPIHLEAGQRCYLELVWREAGGGDHGAVAVKSATDPNPVDGAGELSDSRIGNFTDPGVPIANAGGPYSIIDGHTLYLNGSASYDPDPDDSIISYSWDLNNDGVFGDATGATPVVLSAQLAALGVGTGSHSFHLQVTDSHGSTSTASTPSTIFAAASVYPPPSITLYGAASGGRISYPVNSPPVAEQVWVPTLDHKDVTLEAQSSSPVTYSGSVLNGFYSDSLDLHTGQFRLQAVAPTYFYATYSDETWGSGELHLDAAAQTFIWINDDWITVYGPFSANASVPFIFRSRVRGILQAGPAGQGSGGKMVYDYPNDGYTPPDVQVKAYASISFPNPSGGGEYWATVPGGPPVSVDMTSDYPYNAVAGVAGQTPPALVPGWQLNLAMENGASADLTLSFEIVLPRGCTYSSLTGTRMPVVYANAQPSFTDAGDITAPNSGPQTFPNWATAIDAGASDEAGQALSFVVTDNSNPGLFSTAPAVSPDGSLTFTPAPGATGSAQITVVLHDNGGTLIGGVDTSSPRIITITVAAANTAPVANAQSVTTAEGTAVEILLAGSDVDGGTLSYAVVSGPAHGTLAGTVPNLTYTPAGSYNGADSFAFKVNDGAVDSTPATVSITVTPVNDPPVVSNPVPVQTASYGAAFSFTFAANTFTDVDGGQTLSYSASGLPEGITFDPASRAFLGVPTTSGSFTVTVIASDDGSPALSASTSFTLNVNHAVLSLAADSLTRPYGEANPALTGTLDGVVNGDNITASYATAATPSSPAGAYTITAALVDPGNRLGNYTVNTVNGTLTITPVSQTISFAAIPGHTYGDAAFALNAAAGSGLPVTFSSLSPSVATVSGNVVTIVGTGTATIRATQAGDGNYLAAADVDQTFTVAKANQSISFNPSTTSTYGADLVLDGTANSGLAVSYTVSGPATLNGGTLHFTGVGTVTVTAAQAGSANYNAAVSLTRSISVGKAVLTVTADNKSKVYGQANPALTFIYSGFVNGDTPTVLKGSPKLSTTATTSSAVGTYPITASQGTLTAANYTFAFINGAMAVTAASTTVSAANVTARFGAASITLGASVAAVSPSGAMVNEGMVTFTVRNSANETVGQAVAGVSKGTAKTSFPASTLARGTYTISVTYTDTLATPNFNNSSGTAASTLTIK